MTLRKLRLYVGAVLVGVPALALIVILTIPSCYWAFLLFTDPPRPRGKKDPIVFSSRIDTKIEGAEYFVKFPRSGHEPSVKIPKAHNFQKVKKSDFFRAIKREEEIVRNSYIFTGLHLSFFVGFLLIKSTGNQNFHFRDTSCPKGSRSLKALAKERGITV